MNRSIVSPLVLSCAFLSVCGFAAFATTEDQLYRTSDATMGVNILPVSRNRWRGRAIGTSRPLTDADRVSRTDLDFFTLEYGRPEPAHELVVTGQVAALHWGAYAKDPATPGIRLGRGWGAFGCDSFALELDLEQEADETKWTFTRHLTKAQLPRDFTVKGKGRQTYRLDLGQINPRLIETCGLDLACKTPGAHVKLAAVRLVPRPLRLYWRRRFTAETKPFRAGITFGYRPLYALSVNGQPVSKGLGLRSEGLVRENITSFVRKGENEIVICVNDGGALPVEAFWADAAGRTTLLGGDTSWEWSLDGATWAHVRDGGSLGLTKLPNGTPMADGSMPLHAGCLAVKPADRPVPVFDADAPIAWEASFPAGLDRAKLTATVADAFSGATQAVVTATAPGRVAFPALAGGAYAVFWELASGTDVFERDRTELIVAGDLKLDTVSYAEFESAFVKRLRLLQSVDCTAPSGPRDFIDSGSMRTKPEMNVGRIGEEKGLRFRETGEIPGSFFAYRIDVAELGKPHVIEVDYPDTRDQTLYVEINEAFPVPFCLNGLPFGERGWPNASGAVCCGRTLPLTNEKKTMRVVFFPGSRAITVAFQRGELGGRAAVCGFRVYEVEGGLPALKVPETARYFLNHNERLLFRDWGAAVNPRTKETGRDIYEDYWKATYLAAVNRVQYLKFAGHNASIEGVYMYSFEFPTRSGASEAVFPEFDPLYLVTKMYRHNGLATFLGFEYVSAPNLVLGDLRGVSDRDVQSRGADTLEYVDRYGRQPLHSLYPGLNGMHPKVRQSIKDLLGEIYVRYAGCGVKGLFVIGGGWWLPGYPFHTQDDPLDIGYDDLSIRLFERDTGLCIRAPQAGADRFAKRYDDLTGRLRAEWLAWRAAKTKELADEMRAVVKTNPSEPWRLLLASEVYEPKITPFDRLDATEADRAAFFTECQLKGSFDPLRYDAAPTKGVEWIPFAGLGREVNLRRYGMTFNRGVLDLVRRQDAIYFTPSGLNERYIAVRSPQPWWWRKNGVTVFDPKSAGAFAFAPEAELLAAHTPSVLIHAWLDCNCTTAHAEESRRFLTGYYATPAGTGRPFDAIRGVTAKAFGTDAVQLVNATPYPVSGKLDVAHGTATDALTGQRISGCVGYELAPFGVTVLTVPDAAEVLSGEFHFAPEVEEEIAREWEKVGVDSCSGRKEVPSPLPTTSPEQSNNQTIKQSNNPIYSQACTLRGYEVSSQLKRLESSAANRANQELFDAQLAKVGVARIDCGSATERTDEKGRRWLADQRFVGVRAYGNEFEATYTDRGDIAIAKTDIPSIYRTEACSAKVRYHLPVPDGRYRVRVLFADTYSHAPGLTQTFAIGAVTNVVDVWKVTGGRCHAGVVTFEDVTPVAGEILIEMSGGTVFNGIEVECLHSPTPTPTPTPYSKAVRLRTYEAVSAREQSERTGLFGRGTPTTVLAEDIPSVPHRIVKGGRYETKPLVSQSNNQTIKQSNNFSTSLSLLVRAKGTGSFLLGDGLVRYDLFIKDGKVQPVFTGFPPNEHYVAVRTPPGAIADGTRWHHVVWNVDLPRRASVWIDGRLVVGEELKAFDGKTLRPPQARMGSVVGGTDGDFELEIARCVYREGNLSAAEIAAEAHDWPVQW